MLKRTATQTIGKICIAQIRAPDAHGMVKAAIIRLGVAYAGLYREDMLTLLPAVVDDSASMEIAALSALALGFMSHGQGHDWDQSFLLGQEHLVLDKYHWVLYFGDCHAVDVVGQADTPRTILGF
ncbi:hypothetical protein EV424DRAFT_1347146 [Suillus variegatus]|nr:hypothetical protein EV424DRAFT_1347146 [Suillus variegatus]